MGKVLLLPVSVYLLDNMLVAKTSCAIHFKPDLDLTDTDVDRDGQITEQEFLTAGGSKEEFRLKDRDGDGVLDPQFVHGGEVAINEDSSICVDVMQCALLINSEIRLKEVIWGPIEGLQRDGIH